MKRERAAAKSRLEQPLLSRTESQGTPPCHLPKAKVTARGGVEIKEHLRNVKAPSRAEHRLMSAQVKQHRAPAEPLITTASLGKEFQPPIPARNVQTQGTRAEGSAELHHRNHHHGSLLDPSQILTRLSQGPAPGTRGMPSRQELPWGHQHSTAVSFGSREPRGARGRHTTPPSSTGRDADREGLCQLSSQGRIGQGQWHSRMCGKRERKGQGRETIVLDRCSRLKYLEGVNTERREDLFRQPRGRIAGNGIR